MLFGNTIEFTHMALCLVPEILDAIDMVVAVSKEFGMVDPEMVEVRNIQPVVAFPTVGIDD